MRRVRPASSRSGLAWCRPSFDVTQAFLLITFVVLIVANGLFFLVIRGGNTVRHHDNHPGTKAERGERDSDFVADAGTGAAPADDSVEEESLPGNEVAILTEDGARRPLCGLEKACGAREIAVSVFSGKSRSEVCVEGRVVASYHAPAKRGMVVVVINEGTGAVIEEHIFDTYNSGREFVDYLNGINGARIVVLGTLDDASFALGALGRSAIRTLGSRQIDGLNFRGSWSLIGAKGARGASNMESVSPGAEFEWGKDLEVRGCVSLEGSTAPLVGGSARRRFCAIHEGYGAFCQSGCLSCSFTQLKKMAALFALSHTDDSNHSFCVSHRQST
eukprot:Opistho-2@74189